MSCDLQLLDRGFLLFRHNEIILDIHLNVVVSSESSSVSVSPAIVRCKNSTVSANSESDQSSNCRTEINPKVNDQQQKMRHRSNSDPGRLTKFHENKIHSEV